MSAPPNKNEESAAKNPQRRNKICGVCSWTGNQNFWRHFSAKHPDQEPCEYIKGNES